MKRKSVEIDSRAILDLIHHSGKSLSDVSREIGYSESYMSLALKNGTISETGAKLLAALYHVPLTQIMKKPHHSQEGASTLFHAKIEINQNVPHMDLFCGDERICQSHSRLRGKSRLDLMQAFSYAAHMMYKHEEQLQLAKSEG